MTFEQRKYNCAFEPMSAESSASQNTQLARDIRQLSAALVENSSVVRSLKLLLESLREDLRGSSDSEEELLTAVKSAAITLRVILVVLIGIQRLNNRNSED